MKTELKFGIEVADKLIEDFENGEITFLELTCGLWNGGYKACKEDEALSIHGVSISLPDPKDSKELIEASKQAYTSIRHETNPSNSQLDAYFRLEKILNKLEGNEC